MAETILLALLYAKIKKYKIKPLFKSWTIYPVIAFEIIYLIEQVAIFSGNYEFIGFTKSLNPFYFSAYLLLVFKYDIYISSIIGAIFMLLGGALNDIAIKANDGFMPVYPTSSYLTGYAKPESFVLMLAMYALSNTKLNVNRYIISSLLLATFEYSVRMLPITYGVHTILNVIIMIILICSINKTDIILAIKASLITTICLFILEGLNTLLLYFIFKDRLESIILNTMLKTIYVLPSLICFAIITIIYYSKKKDKFRDV